MSVAMRPTLRLILPAILPVWVFACRRGDAPATVGGDAPPPLIEREADTLQPTAPEPAEVVVRAIEPRFRAALERWSPPGDHATLPRDERSRRRLWASHAVPSVIPDSPVRFLSRLLAGRIAEELIDPTALPLVREVLSDAIDAEGVERAWWLDPSPAVDRLADIARYDALVEMAAPRPDLLVSIYVLSDRVVDVVVVPYRSTSAVGGPER